MSTEFPPLGAFEAWRRVRGSIFGELCMDPEERKKGSTDYHCRRLETMVACVENKRRGVTGATLCGFHDNSPHFGKNDYWHVVYHADGVIKETKVDHFQRTVIAHMERLKRYVDST